MNNSNRADEFGEVAAAVASQRKFAVYHELAARARRTGKAVIVRTGKVAGKPYVDRLYPVRHNPTAARRAARYQSTRNRAEEFLHRCVCTEEDWTFVSKLLAPIKRESVRKGKAAWGTNYRGGAYHGHSIFECNGPSWTRLEKRRGELCDDLCAAAGLLHELAAIQPWKSCILVREWGRLNRRGQPSLKSVFYRLATDYAEAARRPDGKLSRGVWPALARHLSLPEFGINLSATELRKYFSRRGGLSLIKTPQQLALYSGSQSQR